MMGLRGNEISEGLGMGDVQLISKCLKLDVVKFHGSL